MQKQGEIVLSIHQNLPEISVEGILRALKNIQFIETEIVWKYVLKGVVPSIQNWISFETTCCSDISLTQILKWGCYMVIVLLSVAGQSPIKNLITHNSHFEKSKMPKFRCLISLALDPPSMMHMAHSICTLLIRKSKPRNYIYTIRNQSTNLYK